MCAVMVGEEGRLFQSQQCSNEVQADASCAWVALAYLTARTRPMDMRAGIIQQASSRLAP